MRCFRVKPRKGKLHRPYPVIVIEDRARVHPRVEYARGNVITYILFVHMSSRESNGEEEAEMKFSRHLFYAAMVFLLGALVIGCGPRMEPMSKAEKVFVKMVDKTAAKLDLNEGQKAQLERLKMDIRKNFQDGLREKSESLLKIKAEGKKEAPEIGQMTSLLQGMFRSDTERINRAFDLMLGFQNNLDEAQRKKLAQMISTWVAKWD